MNTWTAAMLRFREKDADNSGALTLAQVDDVIGWAGVVDGPLLARLLIGQLANSGDFDERLAERCAAAILATDIADVLLGEVLAFVPPGRTSITVAAKVLQSLRPGHALGDRDLSAVKPFAIYDALDDGAVLFVASARAGRDLDVGATGILLGLESPLDQVASFRVARCEVAGAYLEIDEDAVWLERQRAACPPVIAII